MFEIISELTNQSGHIYYEPYSMADCKVHVGVPPLTYKGVHSIRAFRNPPKAKLFPCFAQGGAFVSNRNINGFVELTLANGSPMHAWMQMQDMLGVGFPIRCSDAGTGGSSFVMSSSCKVIHTPEWNKAARSDFVVYTISCKRLAIVGGVRKRI